MNSSCLYVKFSFSLHGLLYILVFSHLTQRYQVWFFSYLSLLVFTLFLESIHLHLSTNLEKYLILFVQIFFFWTILYVFSSVTLSTHVLDLFRLHHRSLSSVVLKHFSLFLILYNIYWHISSSLLIFLF